MPPTLPYRAQRLEPHCRDGSDSVGDEQDLGVCNALNRVFSLNDLNFLSAVNWRLEMEAFKLCIFSCPLCRLSRQQCPLPLLCFRDRLLLSCLSVPICLGLKGIVQGLRWHVDIAKHEE